MVNENLLWQRLIEKLDEFARHMLTNAKNDPAWEKYAKYVKEAYVSITDTYANPALISEVSIGGIVSGLVRYFDEFDWNLQGYDKALIYLDQLTELANQLRNKSETQV
ncbi:hypothetical protein [Tellurirhabdus bombi]|uniref:hypothetical protein n=1 Tax=Tellurirhabdus bombi TaxID=2907205 RepID=UPI001F1AE6A5|nr:hypothetical protein [Tellurirhabdus bombi]